MRDPAKIRFLENLEPGSRERARVFVERRQIAGSCFFAKPVTKSASKGREPVIHVDDDADPTVGEKIENRPRAVVLGHQTMTVPDRVDAEDDIERSANGRLGDSQACRHVLDEVLVSRQAESNVLALRWREVLFRLAAG